jgi:hypothetical protein
MKNESLRLIEIPKWGAYLRGKWRESFANRISKDELKAIDFDSFLWHLCSWEKVECLEKEEAIEAFQRQIKKKCTIFYQFTDEAFLVENARSLTLKDLPYQERHLYYSDLYVLDWENQWTFMITHESDFGIGPYFIQNN